MSEFEFNLLSDDELLMEEANQASSIDSSDDKNVPTNNEIVDEFTGFSLIADEPTIGSTDTTSNQSVNQSSNQTNQSQSAVPWELQAKALVEQGIWSDLGDTKITTKEEFFEQWNKQKEQVGKSEFDKFKSSLSPEKQRYLDLVKDVPDHNLAKNLAERITTLESAQDSDFDNEEFAKSVYYESLIADGVKPENATEFVNDAFDLGKIKEKALAAKTSLLEHDKKYIEKIKTEIAAEVENHTKKETRKIENIYNKVLSTDEPLPGLKVTKKFKDDIKLAMSTAVDRDANGRPITVIGKMRNENPEEFERALYTLTQLGLLKIDKDGWKPDVSMLKQIGVKSSIEKLDEVVNSGNSFISGNTNNNTFKVSETTEDAIKALKSVRLNSN